MHIEFDKSVKHSIKIFKGLKGHSCGRNVKGKKYYFQKLYNSSFIQYTCCC